MKKSSTADTDKVKTKNHPLIDSNQSLQERLHILLTRIADTTNIIKNWPASSGDESSIHAETTTKLIASLKKLIHGIQLVEEKSNLTEDSDNNNRDLVEKLQMSIVPLDLLDMMDYANGLNPDCFARGLLQEALRQLASLQKRKASLRMLASMIQNGIKQKEIIANLDRTLDESKKSSENNNATKRKRDDDDDDDDDDRSESIGSPSKKK